MYDIREELSLKGKAKMDKKKAESHESPSLIGAVKINSRTWIVPREKK